jgi:hypothetical protein
MAITFDNLVVWLDNDGYTKSHNELDALLLRELPNEYYCFWRYLWRQTFGWQKTADHISLRDIAQGSGINVSVVSRAAWFFHTIQFIRYTPGKRGTNSHFLLFPTGELPNLVVITKTIRALHDVLKAEKDKRSHNKDFRYTNPQFCNILARVWEEDFGGQVERPAYPGLNPG